MLKKFSPEEREKLRLERRVYVAPRCCEASLRTKVIVMGECDRPEEKPRWCLRVDHSSSTFGPFDEALWNARIVWMRNHNQSAPFVPEPTCCPFCGTLLPPIVKNETAPTPLHSYLDEGRGYCGTCHEDAVDCLCWPPWFAWRQAQPLCKSISRP